MGRVALAFKTFFRVLKDPSFSSQVGTLLLPSPQEEEKAPLQEDAVQLLALLQREGRLVDFLREEITGYSDAQIGAAVRTVHAGSRKVLDEYFSLEPVLPQGEGDAVTVEAGFDPSQLRLVGQVAGEPPYRGTLAHHGWKTTRTALPKPVAGQDRSVIAPAEVEVG